jgi:hypothetical protein
MAKKNGKPNDDFPSKLKTSHVLFVDIDTSTNIAKTKVTRFALCVEKSAVMGTSLPPSAQGYDQQVMKEVSRDSKRDGKQQVSAEVSVP